MKKIQWLGLSHWIINKINLENLFIWGLDSKI